MFLILTLMTIFQDTQPQNRADIVRAAIKCMEKTMPEGEDNRIRDKLRLIKAADYMSNAPLTVEENIIKHDIDIQLVSASLKCTFEVDATTEEWTAARRKALLDLMYISAWEDVPVPGEIAIPLAREIGALPSDVQLKIANNKLSPQEWDSFKKSLKHYNEIAIKIPDYRLLDRAIRFMTYRDTQE